MIINEHKKDAGTGYAKLHEFLKDNKVIKSDNNTPSVLKGVVAGAAINHFSTMSPEEQFEIVAGYLKKIGA